MEKNVVIAIPPSYDIDENLETASTLEYINYLKLHGATHLMTTAGTSQYNLLSEQEVHELNAVVSSFDGFKILGIPPLPLKKAIEFVKDGMSRNYIDDRTKFMALYPDRFYEIDHLYSYFKTVSEYANGPIYIHAQKMRHGVSGDWNYEAELLNRLCDDGYIIGIKEEHSSLELAYSLIDSLSRKLHIIVAGGSMRRFEYLESAGANSFLAGIGNLAPSLENQFINSVNIGDKHRLLQIEARIFSVFMRCGWHRSLREALRQKRLTCINNRQPWPASTLDFSKKIGDAIQRLE